jgi:sugar-specific transcriptional regulator TrmB
MSSATSAPTSHHDLGSLDTAQLGTTSCPTELSDIDISVYRYAVHNGQVTPGLPITELKLSAKDVASACARLRHLHLLSADGSAADLVPVSPEIARRRLNDPLATEIKRRQQAIDDNNQLLSYVGEALVQAQQPGIDVIDDTKRACRRWEEIAQRCTVEVLSTHLGAQTDNEHLERVAALNIPILRRGVKHRMIYQHISRSNLSMQSFSRTLTRHGALVRTSSESFEVMTIFDRQTAFIPLVHNGDARGGAAVITNQSVVRYLHRIFERVWSSAMLYEGTEGIDMAADDDRMLLLRLMAAGLKDQAIANRLGMATRTCRRRVMALLEDLGATSRFQAGLKVGQLGILPMDSALSLNPGNWVNAHPLS